MSSWNFDIHRHHDIDDVDAESPGDTPPAPGSAPVPAPICPDCGYPCLPVFVDAAGRCPRCSDRAAARDDARDAVCDDEPMIDLAELERLSRPLRRPAA